MDKLSNDCVNQPMASLSNCHLELVVLGGNLIKSG